MDPPGEVLSDAVALQFDIEYVARGTPYQVREDHINWFSFSIAAAMSCSVRI